MIAFDRLGSRCPFPYPQSHECFLRCSFTGDFLAEPFDPAFLNPPLASREADILSKALNALAVECMLW